MTITINEAIKDLQDRINGEFFIEGEDDCADMKLGIKGLERVEQGRNDPFTSWIKPLPGETKE